MPADADAMPQMLVFPIYAGRRLFLLAEDLGSLDRPPVYDAQCVAMPVAWTPMGSPYFLGVQCQRWQRAWQASGATLADAVQGVIVQMREAGYDPSRVPVESPRHTQEDSRAHITRCAMLQGIAPPARPPGER